MKFFTHKRACNHYVDDAVGEKSADFSVESQTVNNLGFAGRTVSVTMLNSAIAVRTQPWPYVSQWVWLSSKKTLFTKSGSGSGLAHGYSLLNVDMEYSLTWNIHLRMLPFPFHNQW